MSDTSNLVEKRVPNPTGKGGFGDRPETINRNGTWKPENTISFQYRRFMSMSPDELKAWAKLPDKEKTVAMVIAFGQVAQAPKSLPHAKEIADRTEGRASQAVDVTSDGKALPAPIFALPVEDE